MNGHRCGRRHGRPCPACDAEAERRSELRDLGEPDDRERDQNHPRDYGAVLTKGGW